MSCSSGAAWSPARWFERSHILGTASQLINRLGDDRRTWPYKSKGFSQSSTEHFFFFLQPKLTCHIQDTSQMLFTVIIMHIGLETFFPKHFSQLQIFAPPMAGGNSQRHKGMLTTQFPKEVWLPVLKILPNPRLAKERAEWPRCPSVSHYCRRNVSKKSKS